MPGIDNYTKLLGHFDGEDGATSYIAESGQTVTFVGTAQLDTAQKKFGSASLLLDGNSDYITVPDSTDWAYGTEAFTVDFWVRFNVVQTCCFYTQYANNDTWIGLEYAAGSLDFTYKSGGTFIFSYHCSFTPVINTWYHIALVKVASSNTWYMFIDGISQTVIETLAGGTVNDILAPIIIGSWMGTTDYIDGWVDEYRISKGIARWTANFTPPEYAYNNLLPFAKVVII